MSQSAFAEEVKSGTGLRTRLPSGAGSDSGGSRRGINPFRQAPEHEYPAAHDDVFTAYQWTLKNAGSLKGDAARVAVAGESAGGNMAAVVSIRARDKKLPKPGRDSDEMI